MEIPHPAYIDNVKGWGNQKHHELKGQQVHFQLESRSCLEPFEKPCLKPRKPFNSLKLCTAQARICAITIIRLWATNTKLNDLHIWSVCIDVIWHPSLVSLLVQLLHPPTSKLMLDKASNTSYVYTERVMKYTRLFRCFIKMLNKASIYISEQCTHFNVVSDST